MSFLADVRENVYLCQKMKTSYMKNETMAKCKMRRLLKVVMLIVSVLTVVGCSNRGVRVSPKPVDAY